MRRFREVVQYVPLKSEDDFLALQSTLSAPQLDPTTGSNYQETLRVFYLSVSPSLYEGLASSINQLLRPEGTGEMRVVFEKPFGKDLESAMALSSLLTKHLEEPEIFRVSVINHINIPATHMMSVLTPQYSGSILFPSIFFYLLPLPRMLFPLRTHTPGGPLLGQGGHAGHR